MSFLARACLIAGIPVLSALATTALATTATAADDTAAPSTTSSSARSDILAEAVARRQARLAGTVTRLERELGAFPENADVTVDARRGSDTIAGLEVWDLNAERTMLRRRIEALRQRITVFEQIDQHQDKLDRARLVEHQQAMTSLATDRAYAGKRKSETEIRLTSSEWTLARRQAKLEMLAEVRRELDALAPAPVIATPPTSQPAAGEVRGDGTVRVRQLPEPTRVEAEPVPQAEAPAPPAPEVGPQP